MLRRGPREWNVWREGQPSLRPDLSGADLTELDLQRANLGTADLRGALLSRSKLKEATLDYADLTDAMASAADLRGASLIEARLERTDLRSATLVGARLDRAILVRALLGYADLRGASLSQAHFESQDFRDTKIANGEAAGGVPVFSGAHLAGAIFSSLQGSSLGRLDLTGADFEQTDLTGASLAHVDLSFATLRNARLDGAILKDSDLTCADLSGTSLVEADLSNATLSGSRLVSANLSRAKLAGASLGRGGTGEIIGILPRNTDLSRAILTGADLRGVEMRQALLVGAALEGTDLSGSDLRLAILKEACLVSADLRNADLTECTVDGADFTNANLIGATLTGIDIRRARFEKARLCGANLSRRDLASGWFAGADLTDVDFRETRLDRANLDGAIVSGARLFATHRAGWSIKKAVCSHAFWDEQCEKSIVYQPGEFETLHSERVRVLIQYPGGLSHIEIFTLPMLIQELESRHPGCSLRLESISATAGGATATLVIEGDEVSRDKREDLREQLEAQAGEVVRLQRRALVGERDRQRLQQELNRVQNVLLPILLERAELDAKNARTEEVELSVMFLDMQGFSTMTAEEREKHVEMLRSLGAALLPLGGGMYINTWGDAIVAAYKDPREAVLCACKFVRHLMVEGIGARIGMNIGDVIVRYNLLTKRQDIEGDTINIGARLEPLARTGEVLISESMREHPALKRSDFIFEFQERRLAKAVGSQAKGSVIRCYAVRLRES